jgi:hypothetical protein
MKAPDKMEGGLPSGTSRGGFQIELFEINDPLVHH